MNKYQVVMPNGDIAAVAADRMENVEGDLRFFIGVELVGEFRYWHAWNLIGPVDAYAEHKGKQEIAHEKVFDTPCRG